MSDFSDEFDLKFLPAWLKETPAKNPYADYEGDTGDRLRRDRDDRSPRGPRPAGRGGPPGGDEARNRWMKGIIDSTSPEQRARFTEHRRAMEERRRERGLPTGWPR